MTERLDATKENKIVRFKAASLMRIHNLDMERATKEYEEMLGKRRERKAYDWTPEPQWTGVQKDEVPTVWPYIEHLVARALEYADGKFSKQDVFDYLMTGEMQLWIIPGGMWITEIRNYPQSKRADIVLAAGEWVDWLTHFEIVKDWARHHGCEAVEMTGRRGWGRKTGFEEIHRTFRVWL